MARGRRGGGLQRLSIQADIVAGPGAITRAGGNILSSQVDLQGNQAKDGFVAVSVNCEVEQPALQKLLYDLEAGMPLLFVDQLVAEAPEGVAGAAGGKIRVLISVSGQWQGAK